jgi:hypothetical protein
MPKGYTSRQEVENYLLIDIDVSFHAQVDSWIEEIEQYIDNATERNFLADTEESERVFDGDGTAWLLIDDNVEVTKVKIGDEELTVGNDNDYVLYPANKTPKTKVQLTGRRFTRGFQNITVEAKWGYSVDVPADIRTVATVLVAGIINYSLNADGEVQSMTIGRYTVTYKDEKQWQDFERIDKTLATYIKETV